MTYIKILLSIIAVITVIMITYMSYMYYNFKGYNILLEEGMYKINECNKNFMNYGYWDENTHSLNVASTKLVEKLLSKNKKQVFEAKQILDIGCGRGMQDIILTKYTNANITAIDIDVNNIIECKNLAKNNHVENKIKFIEADACKLPFKDNSFDVIISLESAFHYPSRKLFLNEVNRVLRPGGCFLLGDILINKKSFLIHCLQQFICNQIHASHICDKDIDNLHLNLKKHNFKYEIENITNSTFIPFYKNFIKNYRNKNNIVKILALLSSYILQYSQQYADMFTYVIVSCLKQNSTLNVKSPHKNENKNELEKNVEQSY